MPFGIKSGPEMMMDSILGNLGIDPVKIKGDVELFARNVNEKVASLERRQIATEEKIDQILSLLLTRLVLESSNTVPAGDDGLNATVAGSENFVG